jgi:3-oxoacyl-[acyl-carrier protein] reductase
MPNAAAAPGGADPTTKVALVTGGSAGIGLSVCRHLLDAGYRVVSLSLAAVPLEHPALESVVVDLADTAATRAAAAEACARHDVTTIVHNAGTMRPALLPDVRIEDLEALVDLHLSAAVLLVQAALPAMRRRRFGRIVLVSSRAVLGLATRTSYSATKAGMIGMARTWALELARDGITVNVVAPGPIETDIFHEVVPRDPQAVQAVADRIPVGRVGQPADVARAVMFVADPANGFVTGQTIYVCGGTSVGSIAF